MADETTVETAETTTPKVEGGTIARLASLIVTFILSALALVNQYLTAQGKTAIDVDQATLLTVVTFIMNIIASARGYWKDNDLTKGTREVKAIARVVKNDMNLQTASVEAHTVDTTESDDTNTTLADDVQALQDAVSKL